MTPARAEGSAPARIAIGVCTFRRAHLTTTLESLSRLEWPSGTIGRIVVSDNDDEPSASATVANFAALSPISVAYVHAPARNISVARNAVLDAVAQDDYLAFIDDDEIAEPNWIVELWNRMSTPPPCDVVLGPVRSLYDAQTPRWMQETAPHDSCPVFARNGVIRTGYTCNVMLRLSAPCFDGLRFDAAFGCSGGEDEVYFDSAVRAGAKIGYAPDASLTETVPANRAMLRWLIRRRFRMGQTHGLILAKDASHWRKVSSMGVALAKAAACGVMALVQLPFPAGRNRFIMRGALHIGAVASFVGIQSIRLYGVDEPPTGPTIRGMNT